MAELPPTLVAANLMANARANLERIKQQLEQLRAVRAGLRVQGRAIASVRAREEITD